MLEAAASDAAGPQADTALPSAERLPAPGGSGKFPLFGLASVVIYSLLPDSSGTGNPPEQ